MAAGPAAAGMARGEGERGHELELEAARTMGEVAGAVQMLNVGCDRDARGGSGEGECGQGPELEAAVLCFGESVCMQSILHSAKRTLRVSLFVKSNTRVSEILHSHSATYKHSTDNVFPVVQGAENIEEMG